MLLNQLMKFHCLIARVSYCMEEYFSFHEDVTDNSIQSTMLNQKIPTIATINLSIPER